MSNNIGRTEVAAGQNQKEVTINDSDGRIDAALTESLTSDYTSADITLTDSQFEQAVMFITSNLSVARALNVPQIKKLFVVDNTAGTATVTVTRGTGTIAILTTEKRLCYTDGTTNGLTEVAGAPSAGGTTLVDWKDSVVAATTVNGTLATAYENGDAIDGVTLATGDRILLKDQTAGAENGIYEVKATGAPDRTTDADDDADVTAGMAVIIEEGTANGDRLFILTTNDPITVGTTALVFAELSTGGVTTFLALTDTPSSYSGQGGKVVQVNAGATALEFATGGGGGGSAWAWPFEMDNAFDVSAFAYKGHIFDLIDNCTIQTVAVYLATVAGETYRAGVFRLDGSDNIDEITAQSAGTASPGTVATGTVMLLPLTADAIMTAGNRYFVGVGRTDGTDTSSIGVSGESLVSQGMPMPNIPTEPYVEGVSLPGATGTIAKAAPATTDACTVTQSATPFGIGLKYFIP